MSDDSVTLRVKGKDEGATSTIEKVGASVKELAKATAVFELVSGAIEMMGDALGSVVEFVEESVAAADEQEAANRRLAISLANTGQLNKEAAQSSADFAASMMKATTAGDELITNLEAQGVQLGLTQEKSQELVKVALDLAAATGMDVQSAMRGLTATLDGSTGALARQIPELRGLTEEQLKAGAAIDLLKNRFDGFAESIADNVGGRYEQIKVVVGELQEVIGNAVIKNDGLKVGLEGVRDVLTEFITAVDGTDEGVRSLVVETFGIAIKTTAVVAKGFANLIGLTAALGSQLAKLNLAWAEFADKMPAASKEAEARGKQNIKDAQALVDAMDEAAISAAKWAIEADELPAKMDAVALRAREAAAEQAKLTDKGLEFKNVVRQTVDVIDEVRRGVNGLDETWQRFANDQSWQDSLESAMLNAINEDAMTAKLEAWSKQQEFQVQLDAVFDDTQVKELLGTTTKLNAPQIDEEHAKDTGMTIADAFVVGINTLKGSIGDAISGSLAIAANVFSEDIGEKGMKVISKVLPIIGTAFDILSTGSREQFDKMIEGLINGFLKAMENIQPLMDAIVDHLDDIIAAIIKSFLMSQIQMFTMAPKLLKTFIHAIRDLFTGTLSSALKSLRPMITESLIEPLRSVGEAISDAFRRVINWFAEILPRVWQAIQDFGSKILEAVGTILAAPFVALYQAIRGIGSFFANFKEHMTDLFSFFGDELSKFGDFMGRIFDAFSESWGKFKKWWADVDIGTAIKDAFLDGVKGIANVFVGLINGFITAINHIIDGINKINPFDDIGHVNKIEKFATGGIVGGREGAAVPVVAHGGEMILNAQQQKQLFDMLSKGGNQQPISITINEAMSPGETLDALMIALRHGVRIGRINPAVIR